jgi:uncharacterized membrane protein YgdD (TMEM256/DUF423 family)
MNKQARFFLVAGAVSGLLAVALGAFGAHALEDKLGADLMAIYGTGNAYHFYHCFALLAVGFAALHIDSRLLAAGGYCFLAGTVIFSGSLYLLAVTGVRILGAITPIGGVLFIAGWGLFAAGAKRGRTAIFRM